MFIGLQKMTDVVLGDVLGIGKHGVVYNCIYKGKSYVLKKKNPKSKSTFSIKKEAKFLKLLNEHGIGPKLIKEGSHYVVMEKLDGEIIKNIDLTVKSYVIFSILNQCFKMDELGITKFEMTNPYKHIFVKGKKVTMIDFERCIFTEKPKNVNQFCEYLRRNRVSCVDQELLKKYKESYSKKDFDLIKKNIKKNIK